MSLLDIDASVLGTISKLGVGTILCLIIGYVLYVLLGTLYPIQAQNVEILQQHQTMMQNITDLKKANDDSNANIQRLLRGVCLNTSKTKNDLLNCTP